MRIKRLVTTSVLTGAVLFGTAAPAFGYDCFNGSRSDQGNTRSATAPTWWSVPEFLAVVGFTPEQIAAAMPVVQADPRIPAGFTVFYNDHHEMELAQHMRADLAVNGVGIEHSDDYTTPVFAALMEDVMSVLSAG